MTDDSNRTTDEETATSRRNLFVGALGTAMVAGAAGAVRT